MVDDYFKKSTQGLKRGYFILEKVSLVLSLFLKFYLNLWKYFHGAKDRL